MSTYTIENLGKNEVPFALKSGRTIRVPAGKTTFAVVDGDKPGSQELTAADLEFVSKSKHFEVKGLRVYPGGKPAEPQAAAVTTTASEELLQTKAALEAARAELAAAKKAAADAEAKLKAAEKPSK